jgi:hypothetical protein
MLLNSPSVYVRYTANAKKDAYYAAKYCGKKNHKFGTAKRYWMTPGYLIPSGTDAPKDYRKYRKWTPDHRNITEIRSYYLSKNWIVRDFPPDGIEWFLWGVADPTEPIPRKPTRTDREREREQRRYEAALYGCAVE